MSAISSTTLQQPILQGGIRSVNFFTGRLLSAQDLQQQALAGQQADRRLGRATGHGIVHGLEVTLATGGASTGTVNVAAGMAINRGGQALVLSCATTLSLVQAATPAAAATSSTSCTFFSPCGGPASGTFVAGAGLYLLTLSPAAGSEGKAPVSGNSTTAACNTQYNVDAVQFTLLPLPVPANSTLSDPQLRNKMAYQAFGIDRDVSFLTNPFGVLPARDDLLAGLRPKSLTDCDVPLAVIFWSTDQGGVQFIDLWSVRRRLTHPDNAGQWNILTADRGRARGEAMFLQFQAQLTSLIAPGSNLAAVTATEQFALLPPAGLVPVASATAPQGFDSNGFFTGLTTRKAVFIEGAQVEPIIRESFDYPPVDLSLGLALFVYWVRENVQAANSGQVSTSPTQPYVMFTTGQMPFHGQARFDVSAWNFSNFL
jgi:hypothetical protein